MQPSTFLLPLHKIFTLSFFVGLVLLPLQQQKPFELDAGQANHEKLVKAIALLLPSTNLYELDPEIASSMVSLIEKVRVGATTFITPPPPPMSPLPPSPQPLHCRRHRHNPFDGLAFPDAAHHLTLSCLS
jgi:hypothetical protein